MLAYLVCSLLLVADPPSAERSTRLADGTVLTFAFPADKSDDLQAALANHPDVQIAEAELRLAQAKLAKAKLQVAQQVTAARGRVEQMRAAVERAAIDHENKKKLADQKVVSTGELATAATALAAAKAVAAAAEADLKAVIAAPPAVNSDAGVRGSAAADDRNFDLAVRLPQAKQAPQPADGPSADKLRAALAAPCKLDLPADAKLAAVCDALSAQLTAHGLTLRAPAVGPADEVMTGGPFQGVRPLGQWLQAVADTFSGRQVPVETSRMSGGGGRGGASSVSYYNSGRREFYVRDYGLLFTTVENAPVGAEAVGSFLARTAKAAPVTSPATTEMLAKLRANLDRPAKFAAEVTASPKEAYKSILVQAGLDVAVEDAAFAEDYQKQGVVVPAGERTARAYLELLLDRWNSDRAPDTWVVPYVREYGLLLLRAADRPPVGAVRLFDGK